MEASHMKHKTHGKKVVLRHMGETLVAWLTEHKIRKSDLARSCGMSKQWVGEVSHSREWHISTLFTIAHALQVDPSVLLPELNEPLEPQKK